MKKLFSILILNIGTIYQTMAQSAENKKVLVDTITFEQLSAVPEFNWEEFVKVNEESKEALLAKLNQNNITIVLGTWCSDSHYFVGQFVHLCNIIGYDPKLITFIGLDEDKKSPKKTEATLDITFVPTFIFTKKVNPAQTYRIVESLPDNFISLLIDNI